MGGVERVYPVKSIEVLNQIGKDFRDKTALNQAQGRRALTSGEFQPFSGFRRNVLENVFSVGLSFDEESRGKIRQRVINPLSELAHKYGVSLILAGEEDHVSHLALDAFRLDNLSEKEREEAISWIYSSLSHIKPVQSILTGLKFYFDTIVVGPNSYICANTFDDNQGAPFRARHIIRRIMEKAPVLDFPPHYPRYDDIFHSSVARVSSEGPVSEEFIDLIYKTIGKDLIENPLEVRSSEVTAIPWIDFHQRFPTLIAD